VGIIRSPSPQQPKRAVGTFSRSIWLRCTWWRVFSLTTGGCLAGVKPTPMCCRNLFSQHTITLCVVEGVLSYGRQMPCQSRANPGLHALEQDTRRKDRRPVTPSVASHSVPRAQPHRLQQLRKRKVGSKKTAPPRITTHLRNFDLRLAFHLSPRFREHIN